MKPGVSTHVFLQQRLHHGMLDALRTGGARTIEIFAARHHFDYADRSSIRDIADWFHSNDVACTLHQPLYTEANWSRHVAPTINLIDVEKSRRINAMDEVKRAIDSAEQIPFTAVTLHLGQKDDTWSPRSLEHSLTAIEHLKAFAHPLGVKILLQNLQNEVTTPEHLLEIVRVGHFDSVNICLDVAHAHLAAPEHNVGVDAAFELLAPRIAEIKLHDNHGQRDEHLWPGSGSIDWKNIARHIATLKPTIPTILEIAHELNETLDSAAKKSSDFFSTQSRLTDDLLQSNPA
ncbi:sugar phosphate isomerase/epimerase family protein [Granulicella arctica]|uniref:Sugar phosphate isomerase/epimerase n=1 Tax=Granulicella arctica TaxID=940613 RepID=A0A7Y9PEC9_9BACT|nr:sugar phosphate isomerase/epimerase family protein [Granulicella arctica]NYF78367.1 sugar phosphate isomerase/epimerase [Granulicella arctica]